MLVETKYHGIPLHRVLLLNRPCSIVDPNVIQTIARTSAELAEVLAQNCQQAGCVILCDTSKEYAEFLVERLNKSGLAATYTKLWHEE